MTNTSNLALVALATAAGFGFSGCSAAESQRAEPPLAAVGQHGAPAKTAAAEAAPVIDPNAPRPTPGPDATPVPLAGLTAWFDSEGLAGPLKAYHAGNNTEAAAGFAEFIAANPDDPKARPARLLELLSRHDAGEHAVAGPALAALAADFPELSDYTRYYAASSFVALSDGPKALEQLADFPEGSTLRARAAGLRAAALVADGRAEEAITSLEAFLDRRPRSREELWHSLVKLQVAKDDWASAILSRRALALNFPATHSGRKALDALGSNPELTGAEWAILARAYYDGHEHTKAIKAYKQVLGAFPLKSPERCDALVRTGRTYAKLKAPKQAWKFLSRALACEGEPLALATFSGARNRLRAGELDEADRLFRRHVDEFGDRSTVDDCEIYLADIARKRGFDDKADQQLLEVLGKHPDGDMVEDAAWKLLWPLVEAGKHDAALTMADKILAVLPRERSYRSEGRTRYWRGRSLQNLGRAPEAQKDYEQVMVEYPLSWYTLLAYSRLAEMGEDVAMAALQAARKAQVGLEMPLGPVPERLWRDEHFRKALELARLGLHKASARELRAATSPQPGPEKRAWVWNEIALYDIAGATVQATRLARRQESFFGRAWPEGDHRRLWVLAHPRPYSDIVEQWATERKIDAHWVWSIMREESNFNPRAESWANAIGLMQIIMPTAKFLAQGTSIDPTRENLQKPHVAVELGTKYLARLLARHPVVPLASAGYNAGGGAVAKWRKSFGTAPLDEFVERIPYREARGYAKRVTRSLARYTWLYGSEEMLRLDLAPIGKP